jgi:phenylacetic acid degradation operon negative regulatory protein
MVSGPRVEVVPGRETPSGSNRLKARSMLFDLYGDFAIEGARSGAIRLGALVDLAKDLGVGEMATRSAAVRMVQEGWLTTRRKGRESLYALAPRGLDLVAEGRRRIFAPPEQPWDGTWWLVTLSVPESRREVRDRMRSELSWLGFGSPSNSLYLSPRDHQQEVLRLAAELEASDNLQIYCSTPAWPSDPRTLVARAWGDLKAVNQRYREFLDHFRPVLAHARAALGGGTLSSRHAFQIRFQLANHFRRCLFGDPELPANLLPEDWQGQSARRLFLEFHALVQEPALHYFDTVSRGTRPPPADHLAA